MQKTFPQDMQASLDSPPVYRRFLAGGTQLLRLSAYEMSMIVGVGILTALISLLFTDFQSVWDFVSSVSATVITALLTAAIAAGWLGSRIGLYSGYMYLISGQVLLGTVSASERWLAAMATAAITAFALAGVAGRRPLISGRQPARLFYILTAAILFFYGPTFAATVVLLCVLFLATTQNHRGLRFFADPVGITVLLVGALAGWLIPGLGWNAAANTAWPGGSIFSIPVWSELAGRLFSLVTVRIPFDILPWGPLVPLAIVLGIQQGHHNAPFGRFITVWLLTPLGMVLLGVIGQDAAAVLTLPALSITGSIGLVELLAKISRMRRQRRQPIVLIDTDLKRKTSR
ncbi:MAG: hypothetical protein JXM70_03170 [Pirellulales bacterium]|nr:hypothetical protein [Pirellulales bacterium]